MPDCIHHFILDEDGNGKCKKCDLERTFSSDPSLPKTSRRFWEVSYELLKEMEYGLEDNSIEENSDDYY